MGEAAFNAFLEAGRPQDAYFAWERVETTRFPICRNVTCGKVTKANLQVLQEDTGARIVLMQGAYGGSSALSRQGHQGQSPGPSGRYWGKDCVDAGGLRWIKCIVGATVTVVDSPNWRNQQKAVLD